MTPYPDPFLEADVSFVLHDGVELPSSTHLSGVGQGTAAQSAVLHVYYRPFLFGFLDTLTETKRFELVTYTAALPQYADPILDSIEDKQRERADGKSREKKIFAARLYRHHCSRAKRKGKGVETGCLGCSAAAETKGEELRASCNRGDPLRREISRSLPGHQGSAPESCGERAEEATQRKSLTASPPTNSSCKTLRTGPSRIPFRQTGETGSVLVSTCPMFAEGSPDGGLDEDEAVARTAARAAEEDEEEEIFYVKDLRYAAPMCSLARSVLVDNNPVSFAAQLANGLLLRPFYGDPDDSELKGVLDVLLRISACDDIRVGLRNISMQDRICRAIQMCPEEVKTYFTLPLCVQRQLQSAEAKNEGDAKDGDRGEPECGEVKESVEEGARDETVCLLEAPGRQGAETKKRQSGRAEVRRIEEKAQSEIEDKNITVATRPDHHKQRDGAVLVGRDCEPGDAYGACKSVNDKASDGEELAGQEPSRLRAPENGCPVAQSVAVVAGKGRPGFPSVASPLRDSPVLHERALSPQVSLDPGGVASGVMAVKTEWKEKGEVWILAEPPSTRAGTDTPSTLPSASIGRWADGDATWFARCDVNLHSLDGSPFRASSLSGDWSLLPSPFPASSPPVAPSGFDLTLSQSSRKCALPLATTAFFQGAIGRDLCLVQRTDVSGRVFCSDQLQGARGLGDGRSPVDNKENGGYSEASPCQRRERRFAVKNDEVQNGRDRDAESLGKEDVQDTNRETRRSRETSTADASGEKRQEGNLVGPVEVGSSLGGVTDCYIVYNPGTFVLDETLRPGKEVQPEEPSDSGRQREHERKERKRNGLRTASAANMNGRGFGSTCEEDEVQAETRPLAVVSVNEFCSAPCTPHIGMECERGTQGAFFPLSLSTQTPLCCSLPAILLSAQRPQLGLSRSCGDDACTSEEMVRLKSLRAVSPHGRPDCRGICGTLVSFRDWETWCSGSVGEIGFGKRHAVLFSGPLGVSTVTNSEVRKGEGDHLEKPQGLTSDARSRLLGNSHFYCAPRPAHCVVPGLHGSAVYPRNVGSAAQERSQAIDTARGDPSGEVVSSDSPEVHFSRKGDCASVAARGNGQGVRGTTAWCYGEGRVSGGRQHTPEGAELYEAREGQLGGQKQREVTHGKVETERNGPLYLADSGSNRSGVLASRTGRREREEVKCYSPALDVEGGGGSLAILPRTASPSTVPYLSRRIPIFRRRALSAAAVRPRVLERPSFTMVRLSVWTGLTTLSFLRGHLLDRCSRVRPLR